MPESKRGTLDDSFTLNIDLAPTILGAANLDAPPGMQGRDFASLYLDSDGDDADDDDNSNSGRSTTRWRDEFYYEHPTHQGEGQIPRSSALVRKDLKYMRYDNYQAEYLYDMKRDPLEQYDVLTNPVYAVRLAEMRQRYAELKGEVEKPPPYTGITL
jgi:arylsulfatase